MKVCYLMTLMIVAALFPAYGLFYSFEDGEQGWEQVNGAMKAEKGELVVSGSDGLAVLPDSDWNDKWSDYSVECKMMMETGPDNMGIVARYQDQGTYYILCIVNGRQQVEFWKRVGGNYSEVQVEAFDNKIGEWYTFKATAEGTDFKAYVNDELILEASDDAIKTGKAGVRTYSATAHFDDFIIKGDGIPSSPGEPGAAVDSQGKLAATWASIKAN